MINYRLVTRYSAEERFTHLAVPLDADPGFTDYTAHIPAEYPAGTIVLDWSPNSTPTPFHMALWEQLGFPDRRALAEAGFGSGVAPVHPRVVEDAYAALMASPDVPG